MDLSLLKNKTDCLYIDPDFEEDFKKLKLNSINDFFSFSEGELLTKPSLADYRTRLKFSLNSQDKVFFLKRYNKPPLTTQLKNWIAHKKRATTAFYDVDPINKLSKIGINVPKLICFGQKWDSLFERCSFCITQKIPNAESLERKLPDNLSDTAFRRKFIEKLAQLVKKFHDSGFRHRDLYLSHIFYSDEGIFYLIDLARVFKPRFLAQRYRIKDLAQLFYSAPGSVFSRQDRLRFFLSITSQSTLRPKDKVLIKKILNKASRMAKHDIKHGRNVPFQN